MEKILLNNRIKTKLLWKYFLVFLLKIFHTSNTHCEQKFYYFDK